MGGFSDRDGFSQLQKLEVSQDCSLQGLLASFLAVVFLLMPWLMVASLYSLPLSLHGPLPVLCVGLSFHSLHLALTPSVKILLPTKVIPTGTGG
jgi:hypothetical protein